MSPCRKRGEAKGDRQKSDQKRQKSDKNGYQKVTETEKSDLSPFPYPLLRHVEFGKHDVGMAYYIEELETLYYVIISRQAVLRERPSQNVHKILTGDFCGTALCPATSQRNSLHSSWYKAECKISALASPGVGSAFFVAFVGPRILAKVCPALWDGTF